ncbi:metallopeptidase [Legionella quinlivanii]|uniref:Metallopeptidase n=1 Tax=Legionella quinlivanii TaxID=45073 RepID=A0A364LIL8_9GAMM|nr:M13 family metallopeptidase [Legionella quinlivanii]RAP36240.1 metallopeptidase [Legionella quinlivanii]
MRLIFSILLSVALLPPAYATALSQEQPDPLNLKWLDKSISPADNFFAYANGTWQKQNPIPPEYAVWGSFYILQESVQDRIHQMLTALSDNKNLPEGSIEQKIGDFYFSGMDEATINQLGISPLQDMFDSINSIKNSKDLQQVISKLQLNGVSALFNFGSMQDFKNSNEMIGAAMQGGLGLPDRDYYTKADKKFQDIRSAYVRHIAKMLELAGDDAGTSLKEANEIMQLETALANASMTQIEQRNPRAIYHMMAVDELDKITPQFSWPAYFNQIGLEKIEHINLGMPNFFKKMNELLATVSLNTWKSYLRWHVLDAYAPYLSKPFVDQNFRMSSLLTGTEKLLPRWKRVVNTESQALGFAIGKMYVEKYFPPASKAQVMEILNNIKQALRDELKTLQWMSPATREAALKKLELMKERVGYPEKWWDYSSLKIDRGPYVLNVVRASEFLVKRDLNKIGKPIDKTEWSMTPQTVNAYYDPSMNNINLPAGILQPPFFDPNAPTAVNYGAIGFVIGHEITHGFDDQGAQFDGYGNLKNWWSAEDLKKFNAATQCIMEQFSQYKVDDLSVQGKLVMGEATADLGGLTLAYKAFKHSKEYASAKTIDGFTPDQQFFLGTAHVWASNIRMAQMRTLIMTDPHPPMIYRVNGTLANMPQFQAAFGISGQSPMVNQKRCVIW